MNPKKLFFTSFILFTAVLNAASISSAQGGTVSLYVVDRCENGHGVNNSSDSTISGLCSGSLGNCGSSSGQIHQNMTNTAYMHNCGAFDIYNPNWEAGEGDEVNNTKVRYVMCDSNNVDCSNYSTSNSYCDSEYAGEAPRLYFLGTELYLDSGVVYQFDTKVFDCCRSCAPTAWTSQTDSCEGGSMLRTCMQAGNIGTCKTIGQPYWRCKAGYYDTLGNGTATISPVTNLCTNTSANRLNCVECPGGGWEESSSGVEQEYKYSGPAGSTSSDACTEKIYTENSRCAAGFYGTPASGGICTQCPTFGSLTVTSDAGSSDITACYVESDQSYTNASGTYKFTANCNACATKTCRTFEDCASLGDEYSCSNGCCIIP